MYSPLLVPVPFPNTPVPVPNTPSPSPDTPGPPQSLAVARCITRRLTRRGWRRSGRCDRMRWKCGISSRKLSPTPCSCGSSLPSPTATGQVKGQSWVKSATVSVKSSVKVGQIRNRSCQIRGRAKGSNQQQVRSGQKVKVWCVCQSVSFHLVSTYIRTNYAKKKKNGARKIELRFVKLRMFMNSLFKFCI